jgi:hypothetical protein
MDRHSTRRWDQDLFAFDDYGSVRGRHREATLRQPVNFAPYLVSEAVGALSGAPLYRWIDPPETLALQAEMHARVHDLAGRDPRYAGLLGWCGIDYPSLNGGERIWRAMKWAGVLDGFRVAKPAAGVYASQADPSFGVVIVPAFAWDDEPVARGLVATNCEELRFLCDGDEVARAAPAAGEFPGLAHPPAFAELPAPAGRELTIEGFVAGVVVATVSMSADRSRDALELVIEDRVIDADGSDATRFTLRAVDAFGHLRRGVPGDVALAVAGPAQLIASAPFPLGEAGGVGGGYLRSLRDEAGDVQLRARHPMLGSAVAQLRTVSPSG